MYYGKIRTALARDQIEEATKLTSNDLIDEFSISGKSDKCIERIESFFKAGVTQISDKKRGNI